MLRVLKRVTLCGPASDDIAADSAGFMVNEVRVPSSSFDSAVFVRVRISKGLNQLASLNDVPVVKEGTDEVPEDVQEDVPAVLSDDDWRKLYASDSWNNTA